MLSSKLNDITGKLVGNSYTITTYDNYGNRVMTTTGDKINAVSYTHLDVYKRQMQHSVCVGAKE